MGDRTPSEVTAGEIGSRRRAEENERLIQGQGQYVADLRVDGMLHVAFVRSDYAHARLLRIETSDAAQMPGVHAVLTSADLPQSPTHAAVPPSPDTHFVAPPPLARSVVHAVGVPIVAVVADSEAHAVDAAARVEIEYEPLPVVTEPEAACAADAPIIHPEFGTNVAFTLRRGKGDVDAAFASADQVATIRMSIPRLAGVPMEPLGILATWDSSTETLTAWCTTQSPWRVRDALAGALGISPENIRVIAPHVGGGFGVRGPVYPEYIVTAHAAHRLGRPVRWIATRSEDFRVTQSSREAVANASLAATRDGRFLALRAKVTTNLGAYANTYGTANRIVTLMTGAYDIPVASVEVSGVYTNTTPTGAYRGAGRPEAAFIIERLVELMAERLKCDPLELRRLNFVKPDRFPYQNALGTTYDSGYFAEALDRALSFVDYAQLGDERRFSDSQEVVGVGFASYIEPTGGGWESGRVRVEPDGRVTAFSGSVPQGQDHATTFAQIIADRLGVRFEDVTVRQGDTGDNLPGIGTFGSRSTALGGGALAVVADEVFEKARRIAAHLLEASPEDVVARSGRFSIVGVEAGARSVSWQEVATAATSDKLPADLRGELDARTRFDMGREAFAFGTCVAVVGLDPATGIVRVRRLALVHDCGTSINPRFVEAQLHGGLAQGAGEALGEWLRFDSSGQLVSGSLMDYWMPHANDLPSFELAETITPSPLNRLGAKGVGEAGTIAGPPAILHATIDALRVFGVRSIDFPLTPERVWQAIQDAQKYSGNQ